MSADQIKMQDLLQELIGSRMELGIADGLYKGNYASRLEDLSSSGDGLPLLGVAHPMSLEICGIYSLIFSVSGSLTSVGTVSLGFISLPSLPLRTHELSAATLIVPWPSFFITQDLFFLRNISINFICF